MTESDGGREQRREQTGIFQSGNFLSDRARTAGIPTHREGEKEGLSPMFLLTTTTWRWGTNL